MGHKTRQDTLWVYWFFDREAHTKCSALDIAQRNPCKTFPSGKWTCLDESLTDSDIGADHTYFSVKKKFDSYANAKDYYLGMIDEGIIGLEKRVYTVSPSDEYYYDIWSVANETYFLPNLARFPKSKEIETLRETTLPKNLLTLNP